MPQASCNDNTRFRNETAPGHHRFCRVRPRGVGDGEAASEGNRSEGPLPPSAAPAAGHSPGLTGSRLKGAAVGASRAGGGDPDKRALQGSRLLPPFCSGRTRSGRRCLTHVADPGELPKSRKHARSNSTRTTNLVAQAALEGYQSNTTPHTA